MAAVTRGTVPLCAGTVKAERMRCVVLLLMGVVSGLVHAEGTGARADLCLQAMRDFEAGSRTVESERRLRLACYPGSGRAPASRDPIAVDGGSKGTSPLPATPPPDLGVPKAPPVLTLCDTGGCWDNLGNRYNGTGTVLYGPGGVPCMRSGDRIECR